MSKIDEANAVSQSDLEAQHTANEPQWEVKSFDGNTAPVEEVNPEQVTAEPIIEALNEVQNINEGGMEQQPEAANSPQEQEEVHSEGEGEVVAEPIEIDTESIGQPEPGDDLPDWISKLKSFHEDTGGGINEYLNYTKDVDSLNDFDILKEYYAHTKPNYSPEDIDLIIRTKFGTKEYGEGEAMSDEDRLKVLSMKDELVGAKQFLNENKEKYYADLKAGVQDAPEQYKEAVEFHENFKKQSEHQEQVRSTFIEQSKQVFNDDFKGFDFEAGGKAYNLKVGNKQSVMESQLDLNDVVGQFLDGDGNIADVKGWHRALWAAQNADKLFNAGIEAGKAQALKDRAQATKNPSYANEGPSTPPQQKQKYRFID